MTGRERQAAVDMTRGSPVKLILRFTLPLLIGQMMQQIYTLTDTMITGHFIGDAAIAAIGASTSLNDLMINFANGMCNGCGIIIGQLYGAQKMDKLRRATAVMLMFGVGLGALLTLGVMIGIEPLMRLLNTPESVFDEAMRYAAVVCGGVGVTILYNMCASFMRSLGNGRMPLVFLTISCVLNIALDTLFVVVLHIGVVGTALATLIAQCISALLSVAYIARAFKPFLPRKADFRAPAGLWTQMAASGLSMGLMNSVYALGSLTMQRAINTLGETVMAAHTSARRILSLTGAPMSNLGTAGAESNHPDGADLGGGGHGRHGHAWAGAAAAAHRHKQRRIAALWHDVSAGERGAVSAAGLSGHDAAGNAGTGDARCAGGFLVH